MPIRCSRPAGRLVALGNAAVTELTAPSGFATAVACSLRLRAIAPYTVRVGADRPIDGQLCGRLVFPTHSWSGPLAIARVNGRQVQIARRPSRWWGRSQHWS